VSVADWATIAEVTASQKALYAAGAFVELLGIALVASPDLVPGARRLSRWIAPRSRRFENRLRSLVGLRPRTIGHTTEVTGTIASGASVSAVVSVDPGASLERKVDFLLRRAEEAQRAENALTERVASLERESRRRLDELRERMEAHVSTELGAALAEYRPARIIGTIFVATGLALATIANFIA
jgi:hypothetical protein